MAVDQELNREVAFKDIKPQHARLKETQSRFVVEAEVTGGLEHPGIVPVYGLGHFPDGRPFYAMRFVRGQSLHDAIREFHQPGSAATSPTSSQPSPDRPSSSERFAERGFRDLINRLIDVCNAMQYAHDRKVLHRDLKPGNIMLGKYDETLVVDWGQAKATGVDAPQDRSLENELPIIPASGSQSAPTMAGSTIGTPAYMPPEQADGRIDQLGPASDVYSLGATLYEILTGQRPLKSEKLPELLKRVREGDIPPARSINSEVPAALNAVCIKAIAQQPGDRYESAKVLADDLKAWLADEPVLAWPEPLLLRTRRWILRHPALVSATVAGVLMALVGLSVLSAVVTSKNEALTQSEARATAGEQLATENAREAEEQRDAAKTAQTKSEANEARAILGEQLAEQRRTEAEAARDRAIRQKYISHVHQANSEFQAGRLKKAMSLLNTIPFHQRGWEAHYLARQIDGTPLTLRGQAAEVRSCSFSSDGTRIVAGYWNGFITVWDATTGAELLTFDGTPAMSNGVTTVSFGPDGIHIVSGSTAGTLKLWDASSGREELTIAGHGKEFVRCATYSPDGTHIASGGDNRKVRIWNASDGEVLLTLDGHSSWVTSVGFSPDGKRIVSGSMDDTAKVWNAIDGKELLTLRGHDVTDSKKNQSAIVTSAAFSPDGTRIVTGSADDTAKVWDAASGKELLTLSGQDNDVECVAFSPDGSRIATGNDDATLKLWDAFTGKLLETLTGHTGTVNSIEFCQDGTQIVTTSDDRTVKVWDATGRDPLLTMEPEGLVDSVHFSSDGARIASTAKKSFKVWDAASGKRISTLPFDYDPSHVRFSHDGTRIVGGNYDGVTKVWAAESETELHTLPGNQWGATFTADGTRIVTRS